jgi:hypothetical protein
MKSLAECLAHRRCSVTVSFLPYSKVCAWTFKNFMMLSSLSGFFFVFLLAGTIPPEQDHYVSNRFTDIIMHVYQLRCIWPYVK